MKISHLNKTIGKQTILKDISISLKKGEIVGLVGRNGAGKTTLFRTITDFYQKDAGDISIDNESIYQKIELKETIFYLDDQYNFLNNHSPNTIEIYYSELYQYFDHEKYIGLLKKYQLDMNLTIDRYSKGAKALFKVILAFSCHAEYYILDEPFDGLDLIIRKKVISLILNEVSINQVSVLISSHNLLELEDIVDHILFLQDGIISKSYNLQKIKEKTKKVQMVFKKKEIPTLVKNNCQIIQVQGRVIIAIFENLDNDLHEAILAKNPVLFEEVPLTLEDLFSSHFTSEIDYQLFH